MMKKCEKIQKINSRIDSQDADSATDKNITQKKAEKHSRG